MATNHARRARARIGRMPAIVSCGVLLLDAQDRVFTCHATGTPRWDLPKGVVDADESPRTAALREAWEESGLRLPAEDDALADLGERPYLPGKRLHLFAARVADDAFDPARCRCRSFYPHRTTGRPTPEADAFLFQALGPPTPWAGKNLARVLAALDRDRLARLPVLVRVDVDETST
jgi:8-oxo-dGTP pyrophosphatase MutT (NUDIX family)